MTRYIGHCDGSYSTLFNKPEEPEQRTYITLQLYLSESLDLDGGATSFSAYWNNGSDEAMRVEAKQGRVLIFQHRELFHAGDDVYQGEKITMRSDILYEKLPPKEEAITVSRKLWDTMTTKLGSSEREPQLQEEKVTVSKRVWDAMMAKLAKS